MESTRWWNTVRSPWQQLRNEARMDACYSTRGTLPTISSPYHFWEMLSSMSTMGALKTFLLSLIRNWVTWEVEGHPKSKFHKIHLLPWESPLSNGNLSHVVVVFRKMRCRVQICGSPFFSALPAVESTSLFSSLSLLPPTVLGSGEAKSKKWNIVSLPQRNLKKWSYLPYNYWIRISDGRCRSSVFLKSCLHNFSQLPD